MTTYKKGKIVKGVVTGIEKYGAFVSLDDYYSGLIHISELSHGFVKSIQDYVRIGDLIYAEVLDVDDDQLQLKLSIKNIDYSIKSSSRKRKIKETSLGFNTLAYKLPMWIDSKLEKIEKK